MSQLQIGANWGKWDGASANQFNWMDLGKCESETPVLEHTNQASSKFKPSVATDATKQDVKPCSDQIARTNFSPLTTTMEPHNPPPQS